MGCISPATTVSAVFPAWTKDFLDEPARNNIRETLSIVQAQYPTGDRALYLYPLRSPSGSSPPVTGPSLCLPIALGAIAAFTGQSMFPKLLATGDVCGKGHQVQIGAVGRVPAKANFALKEKFSLFMYPAANEPVQGLPDGLETKAVYDLEQAWRWATLYTPGQAGELNTLDTALHGPEGFIANCGNLSLAFLEWAIESGQVEGYVDKILEDKNSEIVSQLVDQLRRCLYVTKDLERLKVLGALIMPGHALNKMAAVSPLNAFRWCSYNFKRANHFGELGTSFLWAENAKKFMDDAAADLDEVVSFLNSCLVNERHNCFLFKPDLPEYFQEKLDKRIKIQKIQGGPDKLLGRLYGTVAQNLGFCGPKHLSQMERVTILACRAFGEGKKPDLFRDWQRQFSYLSYAYLDAGKWSKAREALWKYLDIHSWKKLSREHFTNFKKFQIAFPLALLVRYMADTWSVAIYKKETQQVWRCLENYFNELINSKLPNEHPWQLFAFNLGRLAHIFNQQEAAKGAWEKSIDLCDDLKEETLQIMKLLPLSALKAAGMLSDNHRQIALKVVNLIKTSNFLHKDHFQDLLKHSDIEASLDMITKNPGMFFPFSYR